MEKIVVKNGENGEIYCTMLAGTEPQPRGFSSGTQGTCITLLVPLRNVISERRRLQNKNGEKSGENGENGKVEKKVVKMEKIIVTIQHGADQSMVRTRAWCGPEHDVY